MGPHETRDPASRSFKKENDSSYRSAGPCIGHGEGKGPVVLQVPVELILAPVAVAPMWRRDRARSKPGETAVSRGQGAVGDVHTSGSQVRRLVGSDGTSKIVKGCMPWRLHETAISGWQGHLLHPATKRQGSWSPTCEGQSQQLELGTLHLTVL